MPRGLLLTDALLFWLLVEGIALLALPAARLLFRRLPGGGLVFARPLGLLIAAYPAWLLASLHVVGFGRLSAFGGIAFLAVASALPTIPRLVRGGVLHASPSMTPARLWLGGEILFTVAFFGWALMRSYSPDVWNTEKPMDMAFINSINRSEWFPPRDPWLSGHPLNYYYFGHYLVAFVVRVTGTDPAVGFNLGLALFFALTVTAVFGVASALFLAAAGKHSTLRSAVLVGGIAASFAVLFGNLAGGVQFLHHPGRLGTYDWWSPSRVIPGTANEFPMFSFLLGDLHAHVLAAPFVILALAVALQLALAGPTVRAGRRGWLQPTLELLLAALAVGALYPINSLDYPIAAVLVVFALTIWASSQRGRGSWASSSAWAALWVIAGVVLFLPFWLRFSPAVRGLAVVGEHAAFTRFAHDELAIYGLFLWIIALAFLDRIRRVPFKYLAWATVAALFALVLLAPGHLAGLVVVLSLAAFALFAALDPKRDQTVRFAWLLVSAGIGSIAVGELVYLRDFFAGTFDYRFNTVFKFGFHAWFLLGLAAACLLFWDGRWMARPVRLLWGGGLAALLALAVAYPVAGSYARSRGFSEAPTLDGMRWLARRYPGDARAVAWLRAHVGGTPTVLETVGGDFDFDGRGRISVYTGLPAVIQWPGHEVQWGHRPGRRPADVRKIYSTGNVSLAHRLLERYRVRYVVVGRLERADYPSSGLAKFERLGSRVFAAAGTVIYEIRS